MKTRLYSWPLLLAILPSLLLVSCTGGALTSNLPPMDAEIIQGNTEKAFYNSVSQTSGSVLVTEGAGSTAKRYKITDSTLSVPEEVPPYLLDFSVDNALITIQGQPGIYENVDLKVVDALSAHSLPTPSIDALCKGTQASGYDELRVVAINRSYAFLGVSKTEKILVGGPFPGSVSKSISGSVVTYQKPGFGNLAIDQSQPTPEDSFYFNSTLSIIPSSSPWRAVRSAICHLNNVPIL